MESQPAPDHIPISPFQRTWGSVGNKGIYWDNIGILEKNMGTIKLLCFRDHIVWVIYGIIEKKVETTMF